MARVAVAGADFAIASLPGIADASARPIFSIVNVPDDGNMPGIPGRNKTEQTLNHALTLETLEADLCRIFRRGLPCAAGQDAVLTLPPLRLRALRPK